MSKSIKNTTLRALCVLLLASSVQSHAWSFGEFLKVQKAKATAVFAGLCGFSVFAAWKGHNSDSSAKDKPHATSSKKDGERKSFVGAMCAGFGRCASWFGNLFSSNTSSKKKRFRGKKKRKRFNKKITCREVATQPDGWSCGPRALQNGLQFIGITDPSVACSFDEFYGPYRNDFGRTQLLSGQIDNIHNDLMSRHGAAQNVFGP